MRVLKILSLLSLAAIAGLCFFSWYSGDDICYRNELIRYAVIDKAWLQYLHWDGRSLGIASLLQLFCLKYFPAPLTTFVWVCCFTAAAWMILKIVRLELPSSGLNVSPAEVGMLTAILWAGLWKLVPDILYWSTGGWYCMMGLLGLFWIYFYRRSLNEKRFSGWQNFLIFLVSLVCGNNSHNLVTAMLVLGLIELFYAGIILDNRKAVICMSAACAGLLISGSFVLFAPGNFERLQAISWQGFDSSFAGNLILVFERYCYWLGSLVVLLAFLIWLCDKKVFMEPGTYWPRLTNSFGMFRNKKAFAESLYRNKYVWTAFATISVFSATSFFAVPRTAFFFAVFIVIAILIKKKIVLGEMKSRRFVTGMNIFFAAFLCVAIFEAVKVNSLKDELNKREFLSEPVTDVIVDEIPSAKIPFAFTFVDISSDTAYWVNRCAALYHGHKTIRTQAH